MTPNAEDWAAAVNDLGGTSGFRGAMWHWINDRAHELARIRAASEPPAGDAVAPEGYVLVPRRADDEMMEAAVAAMNRELPDTKGKPGFRMFRAGYDAALAAAPSPAVRADDAKDAERYRWLRERMEVRKLQMMSGEPKEAFQVRVGHAVCGITTKPGEGWISAERFKDSVAKVDAAIDRAIESNTAAREPRT